MKSGLILEGGAMRGMFSCGVIDVLLERGVAFDGAAGISAGAVFGCNYKSRQPGRAIRYNKRYSRDPRYCSLRSLIATGDLYGADFCYRLLPDELDPFDRAAFAANPMEFWIGATDVDTGRPVYHLCTDGGALDMLWLRASASMPVVSRPVAAEGLRLLDGGVSDAVPFAWMEARGYDRNLIVLTQPKGYRKQKCPPLVPALLRRWPRLAGAVARRHEMYNPQMDDIDQREGGAGPARTLVVRPPEPLGIGRTERDPAQLDRVYRMGRGEALRRIGEIEAFLEIR